MAGILAVLYTSLAALPVPFQPVHLLFINLLTDSLPALAIGMEPAERDVLSEKPRNPKGGILERRFMALLLGQGALIAVCTMISFEVGLKESAALASTMAFATLTLARLFHGFNCRSRHSIVKSDSGETGTVWEPLRSACCFWHLFCLCRHSKPLFEVETMNGMQLGCVGVMAVLPTFVIRTSRWWVKCLAEKK